MKKLTGWILGGIGLLTGLVPLTLNAAGTTPALSEAGAMVKSHSRITVSATGKDLHKEELKRRAYWGGGYRKNLLTQKSIEIKIRNTGTEAVTYKVEYYFVAKPFAGGNELKIFDRGSKTVTCDPSHNVGLEVKSKELTAVDRRASNASPRERIGYESDGYLVLVKVNGEEIFSYCSRPGEKYSQTVRDLLANKKDDQDSRVKVTGGADEKPDEP